MTEINKADLEAKLREIEGVVVDTEETVRNSALVVAAGVGIVVGLIAIGIWRARRNRITVEVYRS